MSRFIRSSKYRHVFGTASKRDQCYDSLRVSPNAWDSNLVKVNPLFISVNWNAGGGGAFAVIPLDKTGKLPGNYPLFCGHSAPVLDTDFANFNDHIIASASEDGKVMIWNIPEVFPEGDEVENFETAAVTLHGHNKKVGYVLFHPSADNVLASASADLTVKLWDIETGKERQSLTGHNEIIQSMTWNWNGNLLATTCRDKKVRIFDARSNQIVQEGASHQGIKGSRITWLGNTDRMATTGFSRSSDRQVFIWNTGDLSEPIKKLDVDTSSGVLMPFYDPDVKVLYIAGKGDGNIRYYEFENDDLHFLSGYQSTEPQRGMAFMPKRALNFLDCEIARAFKVSGNTLVEPISFKVPRKAESFQADLYPNTPGAEPALTAEEFFSGKTAEPKLISLESGFQSGPKKDFVSNVQSASEVVMTEESTEDDYKTAYDKLRHENEQLKTTLSQKDVKIRQLEIQLEQLSMKR